MGDLIQVVRAIEARRRAVEWDVEDAKIVRGQYVGDERGYYRCWNWAPDLRDRPDMPAWTMLWRDGESEIVVHDEPPIPAERMIRLEVLGIARPESWNHLKNAPFKFFMVIDPMWLNAVGESSLGVEATKGPPGGAWMVGGPDHRRLAWVRSGADAVYMASCVNMAIEVERDVSRYGARHPDFPRQIEKRGVIGLIRMLRQSIEPGERWEKEPSEALRAAGVELEKHLVAFMAAARSERFEMRYKDGGPRPWMPS